MKKSEFLERLDKKVENAIEDERIRVNESKKETINKIISMIQEQFIESIPSNLKIGEPICVKSNLFRVNRNMSNYEFIFGEICYDVGFYWKDVIVFLEYLAETLSSIADRTVKYSWVNLKTGNEFSFSFEY